MGGAWKGSIEPQLPLLLLPMSAARGCAQMLALVPRALQLLLLPAAMLLVLLAGAAVVLVSNTAYWPSSF